MSTHHEVVCKSCLATFDGFNPTQAHDCACHSRAGFIYGHYGSRHDISCLHWVGTPKLADMNAICDACIDRWLADGSLVYEREYLDFDEYNGSGPS